jgi:hypothetical protein
VTGAASEDRRNNPTGARIDESQKMVGFVNGAVTPPEVIWRRSDGNEWASRKQPNLVDLGLA